MLGKIAREYRSKSEKLGGVLIKVGQFLTTRADILPESFIQELGNLVDRVKPMERGLALEIIEREWGKPARTYLQDLHEKPVASASIGEVYKGKLKDGSDVAVKVQRHRIQEAFYKDFISLRVVFWMVKVFTSFGKKADLNSLYTEMITVMERELDYNQELEYSNYFKERFHQYDNIHIPHYYDALSTEKVLVMEWMNGHKITDTAFLQKHQIDVEKTSKIIFDFYIDQFLNPGKFHADPHAGNILIDEKGTIIVLDFGMVGEIKRKDTEDFKLLVQGFIIDNYDIVIEALDQMNFILENADKEKLKKVLEDVVEMYQNQSLKELDSHGLSQIIDEVMEMINEQPIQMPANYVYLMRAVAIITGILFVINPKTDIVSWIKPKIKDWFGRKSIVESVVKQYGKTYVTDPILSFPRAWLNFLESGDKDREWDKEKHYINLRHQFYLLLEVVSFMMVLTAFGFGLYGVHMNSAGIMIGGFSAAFVFVVLVSFFIIKHYRMIRRRRK
jgi:predicted unusual protein kinase regulating ubiquinone biosynthesis (AarF/ABC1/UbiB family)